MVTQGSCAVWKSMEFELFLPSYLQYFLAAFLLSSSYGHFLLSFLHFYFSASLLLFFLSLPLSFLLSTQIRFFSCMVEVESHSFTTQAPLLCYSPWFIECVLFGVFFLSPRFTVQ
ncbi:hypothetical protein ILYODFUR_018650 [Ilyodon furcidens]|uniref:Uncharacterized protein n=1 Tax=Ilyodon furcidens TaxID=33524 RepID=A0ABV0V6S9_9TELE